MADNLQDLRDAHVKGLPYNAVWCVDGFTADWHAQQLAKGHRCLPSIRLPDPDMWQSIAVGTGNGCIDSYAASLTAIGNAQVPLCLRGNNIRDSIAKSPRWRFTSLADVQSKGASIYVLNPDGTPNQQAACDSLGPVATWAAEGHNWASTKWLARLQAYVPNPTRIIVLDNNEGAGYELYAKYVVPSGSLFKPPTVMQPVSTIAMFSQRMADYVAANPTITPAQLSGLTLAGMVTQYNAFYNALRLGTQASWQVPWLSGGYGGISADNVWASYPWVPLISNDQQRYDASSPKWYLAASTANFGDPKGQNGFTEIRHSNFLNLISMFEQSEASNPDAYREISLSINNGVLLQGAALGKCEVITPVRWGGYVEMIAWCLKSPNKRALGIRHYSGAWTLPTAPMFQAADAALAGDCASATIGDYVEAEQKAVDRILNSDLLRQFWTDGTPVLNPVGRVASDMMGDSNRWPPYPPVFPDRRYRLLAVDVNDPAWTYNQTIYGGQIRVYAVAYRIGDRALLYCWTPCKLGVVNVTLPGFGVIPVDLTGRSSAYELARPNPSVFIYEDVTP